MRISDWSSDVCSSDLQAGPHPPVDEGRGRRRGRRGRVSRRDIVVRYGKAGFGPLFLWLFPMQEAKVAATRARRFVCGLRPFIGAVSPGTEERESSGTSPRHTARFAAPLPRAGEAGEIGGASCRERGGQ